MASDRGLGLGGGFGKRGMGNEEDCRVTACCITHPKILAVWNNRVCFQGLARDQRKNSALIFPCLRRLEKRMPSIVF